MSSSEESVTRASTPGAVRGEDYPKARGRRTEVEESIIEAYRRRQRRISRWLLGYEDLTHVFRVYERRVATLRLLAEAGYTNLSRVRILDVGCGDGDMLREFLQWGAVPEHMGGIDLRAEPIAHARRLNPDLDVRCGSATELPWASASFDLVCAQTVFSSILDVAVRQQVAVEISRVLRPGGSVLWYDFVYDNPGNADVRGIRRREIRALFPGFATALHRITLAPPLARRLPRRWLGIAYPLLSIVPILRTHYLGLLTKETGS